MKKFLKFLAVTLVLVLCVGLFAKFVVIDSVVETDPKALIYGVDGVGKNSELTRTDSAVGLEYEVGASEITSDFDECYPWSEIREVTDKAGNVFVRIPKFYTKVTKNADGSYKHQISGKKYAGFNTLFIDGNGGEIGYILVGKYETSGSSGRVYSKSGQTVAVNMTIDQMRTACQANGAGFQQYDFLIDGIIKELFMIEYATTDSQAIMYGYANGNSSALITGQTDSVKTASGSEVSNTDGKHACKYRGIENLWGNIWKYCDGIRFATEKTYLCFDPERYGELYFPEESDAYTYVGDRVWSDGGVSNVYIDSFEDFPLLGFMLESSPKDLDVYPDGFHGLAKGQILMVGGDWGKGEKAGLWCIDGGSSLEDSSIYVTGRLCYKPIT